MRSERGSIIIEASMVLTFFMFFILFFLNFARVYKAQNIISHGVMQTASTLAMEAYAREEFDTSETPEIYRIKTVFQELFEHSERVDDLLSFKNSNFRDLVLKTFIKSIASDETEADELLERLNVEDGLGGIRFKGSKVEDNEVIVYVEYDVRIPFAFGGVDSVKLTKAAKSRLFKKMDGTIVIN